MPLITHNRNHDAIPSLSQFHTIPSQPKPGDVSRKSKKHLFCTGFSLPRSKHSLSSKPKVYKNSIES